MKPPVIGSIPGQISHVMLVVNQCFSLLGSQPIFGRFVTTSSSIFLVTFGLVDLELKLDRNLVNFWSERISE